MDRLTSKCKFGTFLDLWILELSVHLIRSGTFTRKIDTKVDLLTHRFGIFLDLGIQRGEEVGGGLRLPPP